ncbi:hypothetical protein [Phaffia rhodozyma]|uniref:Uncharacterized protein n=1 Tax=Phaffia rhodozyma TaxID=264483 RepID=A0A0F7SPH9_PHARH|nr:hypothetical protein [Phaffia rhodozyma]
MISSPRSTIELPAQSMISALHQFESSVFSSLMVPGSCEVELICDLPVWDSENWDDLSSCYELRKRTLSTLHVLVEDLKVQGLLAKYRLVPAAIPFSSIRLNDSSIPIASFSPPLDISVLVANAQSSGARRLGSGDIMHEIKSMKVLENRLRPQTFMLPSSLDSPSPTLVLT